MIDHPHRQHLAERLNALRRDTASAELKEKRLASSIIARKEAIRRLESQLAGNPAQSTARPSAK